MPLYKDEISLMQESIREAMFVIDYCLKPKTVGKKLQVDLEGYLGFPAAILLLSITDTIGAFHRKDSSISIKIDGKLTQIKKKSQHFFILNSDYYNRSLPKKILDQIYYNYRCALVHNSLLPLNHFIFIDEKSAQVFRIEQDEHDKPYLSGINLVAFYKLSEQAVEKFIQHINVSRSVCGVIFNNIILEDIKAKGKVPKNMMNFAHPTSGTTVDVQSTKKCT